MFQKKKVISLASERGVTHLEYIKTKPARDLKPIAHIVSWFLLILFISSHKPALFWFLWNRLHHVILKYLKDHDLLGKPYKKSFSLKFGIVKSASISGCSKNLCSMISNFRTYLRWLFKYLKIDSIHLSSRSISAVIYLKVVRAQNHPTILSYRTFGSKESYSFFTTKHSVVKNPICSLLPNIR